MAWLWVPPFLPTGMGKSRPRPNEHHADQQQADHGTGNEEACIWIEWPQFAQEPNITGNHGRRPIQCPPVRLIILAHRPVRKYVLSFQSATVPTSLRYETPAIGLAVGQTAIATCSRPLTANVNFTGLVLTITCMNNSQMM